MILLVIWLTLLNLVFLGVYRVVTSYKIPESYVLFVPVGILATVLTCAITALGGFQ
jgi:hypothetical protein